MQGDFFRILALNPKVHVTTFAVYDNERPIFEKDVLVQDLKEASSQQGHPPSTFIKNKVLEILDEEGLNFSNLDAVVGRGGLLKPLSGGTYRVNEEMLQDLRTGVSGKHISNLGGILANEIARQLNIPAFIVDPVVVDELEPVARFSGIPLIERRSIFHALSQKSAARHMAKDFGRPYESLNLIVAHMGRGITIGLHRKGRVIDVNNGLHGEGPFSLDRAGTLPVGDLMALCYSGKYDEEELMEWLVSKGGLKGYLGIDHIEEIEQKVEEGDERSKLVYQAMCYQIAKEIGALSTAVHGQVDGIILTGALASAPFLVQEIMNRVAWISDCYIVPGEDELQSLVEGTLRVLKGEEGAKTYPNPPERPLPDKRTILLPVHF